MACNSNSAGLSWTQHPETSTSKSAWCDLRVLAHKYSQAGLCVQAADLLLPQVRALEHDINFILSESAASHPTMQRYKELRKKVDAPQNTQAWLQQDILACAPGPPPPCIERVSLLNKGLLPACCRSGKQLCDRADASRAQRSAAAAGFSGYRTWPTALLHGAGEPAEGLPSTGTRCSSASGWTSC